MIVETKQQNRQGEHGNIAITPAINEGYWLYRVHLHEDQYLNAFPKFFTIGIGFALEEDWNTNLPYSCDAIEIYNHIEHNRKYDAITREMIIEAIEALQEAIKKDDGVL